MEDFQYASLNPFDSGVVLFSQFVTGFLSHFIPFAETLGNAIKEFFNNEKDGKCYWENLQLSYNKAKKKVKEIDLSKETIKCEQAIIDRQDIQQEIKYKYYCVIVILLVIQNLPWKLHQLQLFFQQLLFFFLACLVAL